MKKTILDKTQQIQVISYDATPRRETALPAMVTDVRRTPSKGWAYASGGLGIGLLLAVMILGARLWMEQRQADTLAEEIAALERIRAQDTEAWRHSATALERQLSFQNQQLETLQAERQKLEEELVRAVGVKSKTAWRTTAVNQEKPSAVKAEQTQDAVDSQMVASIDPAESAAADAAESVEQEVANPALRKAIEATNELRQTTVSEAPTLEEIRMHIKAGDPAVVSNKEQAKADRSRLTAVLTHPLFIDSAVLAGSLLVPPSLPLTLAQSRLGRSLTRRALKETDSDKSVAGKIAQDVGNMPITRKKRKK